jgi:DNA-binding protein HU-beta
MKKAEFIAKMAEKLNVPKSQAAEFVEGFWDLVLSSLSKGDDVSFPGFGVFKVADRAARMGVNPKTGEKIQIAASKKAKFRVGKVLKEAVK